MEDPGPGALLLLYSAIFTRGLSKYCLSILAKWYVLNLIGFSYFRIRTDLDAPKGAHLMGHTEEGSINVVTLLLSGRATPYLHNGVVYVGDEDHYVRIFWKCKK